MKFLYMCLCMCMASGLSNSAPVNGFGYPNDRGQGKKLEPIITPPVLPVLEHLERDPSTLLPSERENNAQDESKPNFGWLNDFFAEPSGNGGLTAGVSNSASGAGVSHSASQSFSYSFKNGFSASHSASHASALNGFGSGLDDSQARSQASAFSGTDASQSASSAAAVAGGFNNFAKSQSTSSAFGFNPLNGFQPDIFFGDNFQDVKNRNIPSFPFPELIGRNKGIDFLANFLASN